MIYLDNAATSWPKPDGVLEAMTHALRDVGASPGRSGHRLAREAERLRFTAREAIAELFGAPSPLKVVFTANATAALNLALLGLLEPGAHVLASGMEHNAVLRPLRALEQRGVAIDLLPCGPDGTVDVTSIDALVRPQTRLIVVAHISNVCGVVQPIREIGAAAHRHGIPFLVDAAQSAGCWPINFAEDHIDLLAFTGHKGLLGPSGTGGLVFADTFDIERLPPLVRGGTGSRSEQELQPDLLPDKYEAGTPNLPGLAGLAAGVQYVLARGVTAIRAHKQVLIQQLLDGLRAIEGVRLYGPGDVLRQGAAVSFTLAGREVSDVAGVLDERFGILCRPGLHCAPRAHRTLGTWPKGTVRLAPGIFTQAAEIEAALDAVRQVAQDGRHG